MGLHTSADVPVSFYLIYRRCPGDQLIHTIDTDATLTITGNHQRAVHSLDLASTVFSGFAALVSFVAPPIVHLNSMLDILTKDALEIVGLTQ
ncbi:hypothetical protein FRC11_015019, partial [Ceratobasidium sp. 423]